MPQDVSPARRAEAEVGAICGRIFCCKDDDRGNQDCVAQASTRPPSTRDDLIRAILAAQRTHLKIAERLAPKGGSRATKSPGRKRKGWR